MKTDHIEPFAERKTKEQLSAELLRRLESAVSGAEYLSKPFFGDRILAQVKTAIVQSQSPWLTRRDAADYWRCSTAEIDLAARNGIFNKFVRGNTPLFLKYEGDAAIKSGLWKNNR